MTAEATDVLPGTGVLSYLTPENGDVRLTWEHGNADDIATARRAFNDLRGKGYLAYRLTAGRRGQEPQRERIHRFDPDAEQVVLVPALQGG
jgi:hypothetical protein